MVPCRLRTTFRSSPAPSPSAAAHIRRQRTMAHANDATYGNSNSWLADPNDASRSSASHCPRSRKHHAGSASAANVTSGDPCGGASVQDRRSARTPSRSPMTRWSAAPAPWTTLGTIQYTGNADGDVGGDFTCGCGTSLRSRKTAVAVQATGLRVCPRTTDWRSTNWKSSARRCQSRRSRGLAGIAGVAGLAFSRRRRS